MAALELVELGLGSVETKSGLTGHQAQLGIDVRLLLVVTKRMPRMRVRTSSLSERACRNSPGSPLLRRRARLLTPRRTRGKCASSREGGHYQTNDRYSHDS